MFLPVISNSTKFIKQLPFHTRKTPKHLRRRENKTETGERSLHLRLCSLYSQTPKEKEWALQDLVSNT